jgi:Homeodomain
MSVDVFVSGRLELYLRLFRTDKQTALSTAFSFQMETYHQFEPKIASLTRDLWEIRNDAARSSLDFKSILITIGLTNELLDNFRIFEHNYLMTNALNEREGILVALVVVLTDQIVEICTLRWKLPHIRSIYLGQFYSLTIRDKDVPKSYAIEDYKSKPHSQELNLVDYKVSKNKPKNDMVWNEDAVGEIDFVPQASSSVAKIASNLSPRIDRAVQKKSKKTSFSPAVTRMLNDAYRQNRFLVGSYLDELERNAGISKKQIRDWFANKRKRDK